MEGLRIMSRLAHRIYVARRHAISVHTKTGGLSIGQVKEIFTSPSTCREKCAAIPLCTGSVCVSEFSSRTHLPS